MKPSEHAIEDWAKMVLSKPQRSLTEEEARTLIQDGRLRFLQKA